MDIASEQLNRIKKLIEEWLSDPEHEIEATFGAGGHVDSTTFLHIAQRLRSKGFEPEPQDDRLSVLTQDNIRFSIQGLGALQSYCRDDTMVGKAFTAMVKDRTKKDANEDLKEYDVRIKARRESTLTDTDPRIRVLLDNWVKTKKAFRLIRRWSFKGSGIRFDLSIVRSTPQNERREFIWSNSFKEYNIFKQPPIYEVEVELMRDNNTSDISSALSCMSRGIGEVLRAIQGNTILIRKSIKQKVLQEYKDLTKTERFRGAKPITLEKMNFVSDIEDKIPNIRTGYNVTDKADGLRTLGLCDNTGELFLIDMSMTVYRTGLRNNTCAQSLVDGEWITQDRENNPIHHYCIFDIYMMPSKEDVSRNEFINSDKLVDDKRETRWEYLQKWITLWNTDTEIILKSVNDTNKLQISIKTFIAGKQGNPTSIFQACASTLDRTVNYHTDGLILTPNTLPLPTEPDVTFPQQFKWKPSKDNTVDFLINIEKDNDNPMIDKIISGIHPKSGESVRYKTLRLYVGSSRDISNENPRTTIMDELPIDGVKTGQAGRKPQTVYKPILFMPTNISDTMASISFLAIQSDSLTDNSIIMTEEKDGYPGEPIVDRMILEMRYDPSQDPGWRWIPIRVRHDKTERLQRAEQIARTSRRVVNFMGTMNSERTANSVWNSIHDPITLSMIRTGSEQPTKDEIEAIRTKHDIDIARTYYERTAQKEDIAIVRGMRDFHNHWIKDDILYKTALFPDGKSIVDFAAGRAGDLQIWRRRKAKVVFGIDIAGDNIISPKGGAYSRYVDTIQTHGRDKVPICIFTIGTSSKSIITGSAGATPEEADIMRSVFNRVPPEGPIPKYAENITKHILQNGADVGVCMFAIHYFFENKDMLDGLIQNIADTIKTGGYFIGTTFDGNKVFNMLKNINKGESRIGKNNETQIWLIRKEYDIEELTDDDASIGYPIDVEFISIGTSHREYLVSFEYLKRRLKTIGFELLTDEELKEVNLKYSTNTFDISYNMAIESKQKFEMMDAVKEFSFLNRWFIFKRRGTTDDSELRKAAAEISEVEEGEEGKEREEGKEGEEGEEVPVGKIEIDVGYRLPDADDTFESNQIFIFGPNASIQDILKMDDPDPGAGRWLSLNAPFPIRDLEADGTEYPTIEAYLAAMMIKYAGKNPELARNLFSNDGIIHQDIERKRRERVDRRTGKLSDKDYYQFVDDESKAIKKALTVKELAPYKIKIDDAIWISIKTDKLRDALTQRWERDARFRRIVEKARSLNKYMLYYTGSSITGDLNGVRSLETKKIQGENRVGKIIMELGAFKFTA